MDKDELLSTNHFSSLCNAGSHTFSQIWSRDTTWGSGIALHSAFCTLCRKALRACENSPSVTYRKTAVGVHHRIVSKFQRATLQSLQNCSYPLWAYTQFLFEPHPQDGHKSRGHFQHWTSFEY